ncbi:hypothetical protein ACHAW6_012736 [Cyclotella cf. meneghiniana]
MPHYYAHRHRRRSRSGRPAAMLPLLKLVLAACMTMLAGRNMALHDLSARKSMEDRTRYEITSRESFVTGSAAKETNASTRNSGRREEARKIIARQFPTAVVPSDVSRLPLALQPVDFPNCCPVIHRPPKKPRCGEVCLTAHACNNSLYPFDSTQQIHFLRPRSQENRDVLRARCNRRNSLQTPPYQWCQQWRDDSIMHANRLREDNGTAVAATTTFLDPYAADLPPPGCSIFNNGGGSGSFQHLLLFPSVKMAFCGIPKVGITQWMQFLRFTFGAKDYLSSPHIKPEVFAMRYDKMNEEAQAEILNGECPCMPYPNWKFVAFLRDPAERLLSAYLDKVVTKRLERDHFQRMHGLNRTLSFEEFIGILAETPQSSSSSSQPCGGGSDLDALRGVNWCTNPHWRPQTFSCGLSEFLPRFTFVGSLDHIESQSRRILQHVGLWEDYGRWYHWHTHKKDAEGGRCGSSPPSLAVGEPLFGFQQTPRESGGRRLNDTLRASDTGYGHATDSRSKMNAYYRSADMLDKVKRLYEQDYKLWELVNEEELHSGKELAMKLSEVCRRSVS